MPHLILELSANIDQPFDHRDLFQRMHSVLQEKGGINLSNCKSRVVRHQEFYVADGDSQHAMIHLTVSFLEGRTSSIKQRIGECLLVLLKKTFQKTQNNFKLQITIHFQDIVKSAYFKHPQGTFTPQ